MSALRQKNPRSPGPCMRCQLKKKKIRKIQLGEKNLVSGESLCVCVHTVWGRVTEEASRKVTLKSRSQGRLEISISKGKGDSLEESVP